MLNIKIIIRTNYDSYDGESDQQLHLNQLSYFIFYVYNAFFKTIYHLILFLTSILFSTIFFFYFASYFCYFVTPSTGFPLIS